MDLQTSFLRPSLLNPSGVLVAREDLKRLNGEISGALLSACSHGCSYRTLGGMEFIRVDSLRAAELGLPIVNEEAIL